MNPASEKDVENCDIKFGLKECWGPLILIVMGKSQEVMAFEPSSLRRSGIR